MKTLETDILVVGGGPGGSTAARFAARSGARTLLIEKRQEIGSPVRCAEAMAKGWMQECEISPDPGWVVCNPKGARIFAPDGKAAVIPSSHAEDEVGVVVERTLFDKALARLAAEAGAQILLKTHALGVTITDGSVRGVTGKTMGEEMEIRATVTIAADGFESQLGRWAGMETGLDLRDITSTFQYRLCNIECNPAYCDFYVGSFAPGGYVWVFPKGNGTANVGIGIGAVYLKEPGQTKDSLDRWIASKPEFSNGQALDMVSGGVSTNKPLPELVSSGFMMVGDAARMINPLTGGGIVNACISGKLAGETAAEAVRCGDQGKEFLQKYERNWRRRMEKSHLRNWKAKQKFNTIDDAAFNGIVQTLSEAKPHANSLSLLFALAKKHPSLVSDFIDLLWT